MKFTSILIVAIATLATVFTRRRNPTTNPSTCTADNQCIINNVCCNSGKTRTADANGKTPAGTCQAAACTTRRRRYK